MNCIICYNLLLFTATIRFTPSLINFNLLSLKFKSWTCNSCNTYKLLDLLKFLLQETFNVRDGVVSVHEFVQICSKKRRLLCSPVRKAVFTAVWKGKTESNKSIFSDCGTVAGGNDLFIVPRSPSSCYSSLSWENLTSPDFQFQSQYSVLYFQTSSTPNGMYLILNTLIAVLFSFASFHLLKRVLLKTGKIHGRAVLLLFYVVFHNSLCLEIDKY